MKCSKGGVSIDAALGMDVEDFSAWIEAAGDLESRIAESAKG